MIFQVRHTFFVFIVLLFSIFLISGCIDTEETLYSNMDVDKINASDLQPINIDCAKDGEKIYVNSNFGPTQCCNVDSAIKHNMNPGENGVCLAVQDDSKGICDENWSSICGDGQCDVLLENECDCPLDCSAKLCKPAGYQYVLDPESKDFFCCVGSQHISVAEVLPDGLCSILQGRSLCSECGNEICDDWENICNCQEDCS